MYKYVCVGRYVSMTITLSCCWWGGVVGVRIFFGGC